MATFSERLKVATKQLTKVDPVFARAIKQLGPCTLKPERTPYFMTLAESIAYQQLSGKAAATIWGRVAGALGNDVTPKAVLPTPYDVLRACGLSNSKTASLIDLATKCSDGTVQIHKLGRLPDEEIISELVQVRGIEEWTAHMFLMFRLGRLDVWPTTDYGVQKGYAKLHSMRKLPTPKQLAARAVHLSPARTLAAWYCWRAVDTKTIGTQPRKFARE